MAGLLSTGPDSSPGRSEFRPGRATLPPSLARRRERRHSLPAYNGDMDRIGLKRMHHVSFAVADLAASKHFFCEVLGLPEDERPAFGFPGAWLAVGDRQIHLIQEESAGRAVRERISRSDHLAMEVGDLEVVKARLSECGIRFAEGHNLRLGMSQAFCSDPDGHTIEFVQYH